MIGVNNALYTFTASYDEDDAANVEVETREMKRRRARKEAKRAAAAAAAAAAAEVDGEGGGGGSPADEEGDNVDDEQRESSSSSSSLSSSSSSSSSGISAPPSPPRPPAMLQMPFDAILTVNVTGHFSELKHAAVDVHKRAKDEKQRRLLALARAEALVKQAVRSAKFATDPTERDGVKVNDGILPNKRIKRRGPVRPLDAYLTHGLKSVRFK